MKTRNEDGRLAQYTRNASFPLTILIATVAIMAGLLSCRRPLDRPVSVPSAEFSPPTISGSVKPGWPRDCAAYWKKLEAIRQQQARYFNKRIIPQALHNPELTSRNREFLYRLSDLVNDTLSEEKPVLKPEQLLFPVFTLTPGIPSIIAEPEYRRDGQGIGTNISLETSLVQSSAMFNDTVIMNAPQYYPDVFEKILHDRIKELYIYTDQRMIRTRVQNLGYFADECREYYLYPLQPFPVRAGEKLLFGSSIPLDLDYANDPETDTLLHRFHRLHCDDCPSSHHKSVSFARLKGVEKLYFIYADTFPVTETMTMPLRALVMIMEDGSPAYLWIEEPDFFGCSCL